MKNLTLRYCATHFMFWAASSGAACFSTAYLLSMGLDAGIVGIFVGSASLLSCVTQPIMAGIADRSKRFVLPYMMIGISVICAASFAVQLFTKVPIWLSGFCYMVGMWSSDAMIPLLNAYSVAYQQAGFQMDYGTARGVGSVASALVSLALGYVIALFGTKWMIVLLIVFRLLCILLLCGYPRIHKMEPLSESPKSDCGVLQFAGRYRWYCVSLIGILFLGMFHVMTENYLIAIVGRFGGTSAHVGTALFIAGMAGSPVIMGFRFFEKRIPVHWLLRVAALSFFLKSVLFYFASGIGMIYSIQFLQITSYAFLAPAQVAFAKEKVHGSDMVKGQAFMTAAYTLGCSTGNVAGGQFLTIGVDVLLIAGIGIALLGTAILFLTVDKTDGPIAL